MEVVKFTTGGQLSKIRHASTERKAFENMEKYTHTGVTLTLSALSRLKHT